MFVVTLKSSTVKVIGLLAVLGIVVAAASWEGRVTRTITDSFPSQSATETAKTVSGNEIAAATNMERVAFLKSMGLDVDSDPCEVAEITIPPVFNSVYNNYNALQKSQGYDLTRYRGVRAKRYSYNVKNYPGQTVGVRANMLIYCGKLIGGDVSSVALDGFMKGFKLQSTKQASSPEQADIVAASYTTYTVEKKIN